MDQNNLFTEDIPATQLLLVPQDQDEHEDFDLDELAVIAQKKKRVFLTLISVLILFVAVNVGYFLYSPDAFATIVISIFFLNLSLLAGLYYVKKKKNASTPSAVMSVLKEENPSNSLKK